MRVIGHTLDKNILVELTPEEYNRIQDKGIDNAAKLELYDRDGLFTAFLEIYKIPAYKVAHIDRNLFDDNFYHLMTQRISELSPSQKELIELRFGLLNDGKYQKNLKKIGETMKNRKSTATIYKLRNEAFRKMRDPYRSEPFRPYREASGAVY